MAAARVREEREGQDFMVRLPIPTHQDLQDVAIQQTRRLGRKVPMTEIARNGIERELRRLKK